MNLQRIAAMADDGLTSYEGDGANNVYTGFGDDLVDFDGQNIDFANEAARARTFTLVFTNFISTGDKIAMLCPSYAPTYPAGNVNGAPIADGVMITDPAGLGATKTLSASGSPATIAELLAFIKDNPARLIAMKIVSNDTAQLAKMCTIKRRSPFRQLENEYLNLADYTVETSNNDKMLTIRGLNYQFDNQTEFWLPIPASADGVAAVKTTVTLKFGAVLNTAAALNKKANKAGYSPRVAQGRAIAAGQ